ncbi:MAG: hypothetical protein N3A72_00595 [bacterium]|nr:hypothetical protein [bacterium]
MSSLLITSWKPLATPNIYSGSTSVGFGAGQQEYAFAVDRNGYPHIVYAVSDFGNWEIYYVYWNGSVWTTRGTGKISNTLGISKYPSITLDKNDFPYIAWTEIPVGTTGLNRRFWSFNKWMEYTESGSQIYLIRWDGTNWVTVGEDSNISKTTARASEPYLTINSQDNLCIIWKEDFGDYTELQYREWTGTIWTTQFPFLFESRSPYIFNHQIQFDSNDTPHLVWHGGNKIFYAYLQNTAWIVDSSLCNEFFYSNQPSLALTKSGNPCIAWVVSSSAYHAQIVYREWNGSIWTTKGNLFLTDPACFSAYPSLALDTDDQPHISWWHNSNGDGEVYYQYWNGSIWTTLGKINISNNPTYSESPRLVIDKFNRSHILWQNENAATEILAYKYWTGSHWTTRGGSLYITPVPIRAGLGMHGLATDIHGHPHLVWSDYLNGNLEICYLEWNGSIWTTKGTSINISQTPADSRNPCLVLDNFDNPHIAWQEGNIDSEQIYYVKWNGSVWTTLGTSRNISQSTGIALSPSLALDKLGYPHIAWMDSASGNFDIYYRKWTGTDWSNSENITRSSAPSYQPSLAVDTNSYPHLAWLEHLPGTIPGGSGEIYYQFWNGSVWTTLANLNISQTHDSWSYSQLPSLCLDSRGYPHVVWSEVTFLGTEQVYYREWNGTHWVTRGSLNISSTVGNARSPCLALDTIGYPHIAWYDTSSGNKEIYYKYWNGNSWTSLNDLNISHTSGGSEWPALSLDQNGLPHIAWNDWTPGVFSIYYLEWHPTRIETTFWESLHESLLLK